MIKDSRSALASFSALLVMVLAASVVSAAEFYKDKTVRLIVGAPPGGGFDTYTRTIARSIPDHIPGKPKMIVQNMPGASFAISMNASSRSPHRCSISSATSPLRMAACYP